MKKHVIYCVCLLYAFLSCVSFESVSKDNIYDFEYRNSLKNIVDVETSFTNDIIFVRLNNITNDTIYLFDNYLQATGIDKEVIKAREIYRYNKTTDTYKISFQPIHACLFYIQDDRLILGSNRIRNTFQIKYSFHAIPPKTNYDISVPYEYLPKGQWIDDFDVDMYNTWDFGMQFTSNNKNEFRFGQSKLIMEICLYETIENLNLDYLCSNPNMFDKKVKDYHLLSIPIDINDSHSN